ncbi:NAD(P)-dependent oxidoreductase [Embleya sp. NPDC050154]|uniref:NAD(P)-dependent oxidoreductase n=1 Tax=Embleya sp. NPDC050154 TaxID=3363988 RepID=UPI0037AF978D
MAVKPVARILILDSAPDEFVADELEPLLRAGFEVTLNLWRLADRDEIRRRWAGRVGFLDVDGFDEGRVVDAVVGDGVGFDVIKTRANLPLREPLLRAATGPGLDRRLRVIGQVGAGTDNIDKHAAGERGVVVTHTPGLNAAAVAEHALAMILALTRNLVALDREAHRARWRPARMSFPPELADLTLGIVGPGRSGTELAWRARALGMGVTAFGSPRFTPAMAREAGMGFAASLDELLAGVDVLSLHCPLSEATRDLIGDRELGLMRPGAILVNVSRGGVVDEEALARALRDDAAPLAAAAVDVFALEHGRFASPLTGLPNAVLTPHVAGMTGTAIRRAARTLSENIVALIAGHPEEVPVATAHPEEVPVATAHPEGVPVATIEG